MKNDLECNKCMYKHVPSSFTPCLGCKNNMDYLKERRRNSDGENNLQRISSQNGTVQ